MGAKGVMSDLLTVMNSQARRTWYRLFASDRVGFSTGEETLTDILLLDTHLGDREHFLMHKFSRREESRCGADWEAWIFGGPGHVESDAVVCTWVQAKRMFRSGRFESLKEVEQIERLNDQARSNNALALVALYSFARPDGSTCCGRRRERDHFGCTVVPAEIVLDRLRDGGRRGRLGINDFGNNCRPWRCLACPKYFEHVIGARDGTGVGVWSAGRLPSRVWALVRHEPQQYADAVMVPPEVEGGQLSLPVPERIVAINWTAT
jgi:hypothetical protein